MTWQSNKFNMLHNMRFLHFARIDSEEDFLRVHHVLEVKFYEEGKLMKKISIMLFGVFFFLFSSIVYAADRPILDIEGRYWFPKLSTDWKVGNNATDVDDGTLGLSNKNFIA